jgi:dihydropteroate synthase
VLLPFPLSLSRSRSFPVPASLFPLYQLGMAWQIRGRELPLDRPCVMGILNVTPDSFSDGGSFLSRSDAIDRALQLLDEGADIVDIGGESTRPGAVPVAINEELERVIPVIEELARRRPDSVISADTVKSEVARQAIAAGAHIVNDVSGLRLDAEMVHVCAETGAGLVLMHSRGTVSDMASFTHAIYDDVLSEVSRELETALENAQRAGVAREAIAIDPGIGFSKTSRQSIEMLRGISRLVAIGRPVVVGVSRKRFVGEITGAREPTDRLSGTLGASVGALALGARIFRVHDVRPHREALDVAWQLFRDRDAGSGMQ